MRTPGAPEKRDGETLDAFFRGRIAVLQSKNGYRFSVDAPLLADFTRTRAEDEALEIGTGCGIVALLVSIKPFRRLTAIEIQEGLADLARRNVALNGLEPRIEVVRADLNAWRPDRRFDLIFANPPYIRRASGVLSPTGEKSAAKHEIHCDIKTVLGRTAEWLAPDGRACFVYPERRREDFLKAAGEAGLALRVMREVRPRASEPPNLFLSELGHAPRKDALIAPHDGGARQASGNKHVSDVILPPLVLFERKGVYTAEAEAIFAGRA